MSPEQRKKQRVAPMVEKKKAAGATRVESIGEKKRKEF
jgi:hypothetical protein